MKIVISSDNGIVYDTIELTLEEIKRAPIATAASLSCDLENAVRYFEMEGEK